MHRRSAKQKSIDWNKALAELDIEQGKWTRRMIYKRFGLGVGKRLQDYQTRKRIRVVSVNGTQFYELTERGREFLKHLGYSVRVTL